jgi:TetR/AcrR family transcriptional regulator, cholesterol catabolism regulator
LHAVNERVALRQEERRDQLRQVALRVFSARGYRATSMQDLAREAGMGKATLYHYFTSKEELLTELYEEVIRDNVLAVLRIADREASAVEALTDVIVGRVVYTCRNRQLLNVFFEEEAELPPRMRGRLVRARREYEAGVLEIVERGRAAGEIVLETTPRVFINTLLGAANWVYKWYDPKGALTPEQIGHDMSRILLGGVIARDRP